MTEKQTSDIIIRSTPEELFALITDIEMYPEWMTGIEETEVHEVDDDGYPARASMVVDASIKTVRYTLVYEYEYPTRIAWTSEPGGDLKLVQGSYTFEDLGDDTTKVTYGLTLDVGFPVPGFMIRKVEKQIMGTALHGLKERAEY